MIRVIAHKISTRNERFLLNYYDIEYDDVLKQDFFIDRLNYNGDTSVNLFS